MKNELTMQLFSRRILSEELARKQITSLSSFDEGLMLPDKCGVDEPARTPFDPADTREPTRWLSRPNGAFFYRKGRPIHVDGAMWNLTWAELWGGGARGERVRLPPRFPQRVFVNKWNAFIDGKWAKDVGVQKLMAFVCEMFLISSAEFGFFTTLADLNAKNRFPEGTSSTVSYQGLDPAKGVPGLYAANFFSRDYADWLSVREVPEQWGRVEDLPGGAGALLRFCDSPFDAQNPDIQDRQRRVIDWLGEERFFDINRPKRTLEVPNWKCEVEL